MTGVDFDALTKAFATGKSRRQALRGLFGTVLGVGLLGSSMGKAEAAQTTNPSRADIARLSAQLLARMPDPAKLQNARLPRTVLSAIQTDHQLLRDGIDAQTWSDSQLQEFQTRVSASMQQHQRVVTSLQISRATLQPSPSAPTNAACYSQCTSNFLVSIAGCGPGLGGLLCELLALVSLDLCVVGCILGGVGL